jgi:hypothetical protein
VAGGDPLPVRNGSRGLAEPDAAGLAPRFPAAGPLPARNGYRDHDDRDASGFTPRVPAAGDARPARGGPERPGGLPASGPPRGGPGGTLPSRNGGGRDDPFSSEWQGADPAARGQNGQSRGRPGERLPEQLVPGDHVPAEARPDDPPPRRHDGLTPEQEVIADQALSRHKAADGRNVFGGYGESGLTPAMRRVEAHLPHGRLAPDVEQYSLKSPERYKDKLARLIARHPGIPAAELAAEIYDAARYTFVFEPQDYTDGTWLVHRRLKAQGFDLEARRNRWDTPEFKGIRTRWRDPAHDLAFEVQFHTPASWDVVQRTHEAYLRITDPRTSPAERAALRERQVAAAAGSRPPARCAEIGDFRADVR